MSDDCVCGHDRRQHAYVIKDGPCGARSDGCEKYTPDVGAAALTEQIAELLAEHRLLNKFEREGLNVAVHHACSCDEWSHTSGRNDWPELHRAHVAAEIAARLADSRPVVSEDDGLRAALDTLIDEWDQRPSDSALRQAQKINAAELREVLDSHPLRLSPTGDE